MPYDCSAPIDTSKITIVATGHGQTKERWDDVPGGGRRNTGLPVLDEVTGAPQRIYDLMMPTGKDGRHELHGVLIASHEVPDLAPYAQVEVDNLWVRVRPARNGGKGVEVSFTADAIRPGGTTAATRTRRTGAEQTEAA